jgi:putative tricarboxylic transport membrane protein
VVNVRNAGVWAAVLMLVFSGVIFWQSLKLDYEGPLGFGPAVFPFWLSLILIILSVIYLFSVIKNSISIDAIFPKGQPLTEFLVIIGSMLVFIILINIVGFTVAGTLSLCLLIYRSFNKYMTVLISAGITVMIFLIFAKALDVPLPVNSFGW